MVILILAKRVDVLKFEQSGGIENLVFVHSSTTPDGRPSVISLYERKRIGVGVYDGRLDDAFVEQPISGSPSYQVDPNNPTLQNAHDVGVEKIHEQLPQNII
jgi:hypothetical protein